MKAGFFPMLAVSGMRKNRQLYTPYLLACAGIVCVSYIVAFLGVSPVIRTMRGGTSTTMILQLGKGVMAVFSAIFLFYSHSFLIRRRKREFGLYNMLGMGKRSIGRILLWEALMSAALSLRPCSSCSPIALGSPHRWASWRCTWRRRSMTR